MSRARALAAVSSLVLVVAGCGGESDTPVDPGNPGPRTPAAVSLATGDQQQAAAGTAVAVPPSVTVRDAQGQPVAGVTVQFTVAAGGGQVAGATPVTNASGTASVTSWVLGPNGEQRLSAQVGSLPAVTFQASITPGTGEHVGSVGSGGGTVAIAEPGHPYHGLTLTIPAGTVAGPTDWRFRLDPSPPGLTLPAGIEVAGPVLEISTSLGRGNRLMTLEVPVDTTADGLIFLALHDPVRNVVELLPIIDRTATSVVVATAHLRGSLILGPAPLDAYQAARGFTRASVAASDEVARLVPLAIRNMTELLTALEEFTTLMNRWPVQDHGSAAFPEGHGAGITVLEAVASAGDYPALSTVVKPLSIEGFYAEAAPLAVAQMAQQQLSAALTQSIAELAPMFAQHDKPMRDALVLENIVASVRLTGRASLVAGISNAAAGVPVAASVVSGAIGSLSLVNPATAQPTQISVGAGGLGTIALPLVANGEAHQLAEVVPLSSFVIPTEGAQALLASLRRASQAPTEALREVINRELAAQAGLPELDVEVQHLPSETWTTAQAATGIAVVARNQVAQVRVLSNAISVHRPDGSELARSVGEALSIADDLALASEPTAIPVGRTISAFVTGVGGAIKQVAVAQARVTLAPFAVKPEETILEDEERTVELTASVPLPPAGGFLIEWKWGDGETTEHTNTTNASHEYESNGSYNVVATLMTSTDRRKLAVDTVRVRGKPIAWVGWATYVQTDRSPSSAGTFHARATDLRFEARAGSSQLELVDGRLNIWTEAPCAGYVSTTVIVDLARHSGKTLSIQTSETDPLAPPGEGSSGLWYYANGAVWEILEIYKSNCPSTQNPNPDVYPFTTGVVWLLTFLPSTPPETWWTRSEDRDVIEGTFTRQDSADISTVWTWRFERDRGTP